MNGIRRGRVGWLVAAYPRVTLFIVLSGGLWLLAGQLWQFVPPLPKPPNIFAADASQAATSVANHHLFGAAQQSVVPPPAESSYQVLGIIAATRGQSSVALLQAKDSKPVAIQEGGEVEPGVRLKAVGANSVRLDVRGNEITVGLPERTGRTQ